MTGTFVPFSWNIVTDLRYMLSYNFMVNAFETGTIIAIVAGIVGYFVVLRRLAFATHALGHVGFSGAAGAVVFGVNPVYGLLLFTMSGATGMALLGRRASNRDIEIGTVLAFMLGLGLLFLSLYSGYDTAAYSILFGEILAISNGGVVFTLETSIVVLAAMVLIYRRLMFASLDEDVAEAKGMPMMALGVIFMLLLAVAISIAVQIIGVLLIFALIVTPAAIAVRLTRRPLYAVIVSVLVALFAVWVGLFVQFYSQFPASFFIVTIAFSMYMVVRAGQAVSGWVVRRTAPVGPLTKAPASPAGEAGR
jgi:zinc/manganese transport system permease protein